MRLITSEMKDQLNWFQTRIIHRERERERERTKKKTDERENEKKHERKEWKEISGNVVPSVDANRTINNITVTPRYTLTLLL